MSCCRTPRDEGLTVKRNTRAVLITLTVAFSVHSAASAQESDVWNRIRIDAFRPELKSPDYTFASSVWFVTLHESVEGPVHVDIQIPFAYLGRERQSSTDWEFRLANPYLGLSWTSQENPATLGFGLRFPVLPDDAGISIMRGTDIHRYEAFVPDLWDISVHSVMGDETTPVRARARANFWLPLHGTVEVVTDYAFGVQRFVAPVLFRVEVLGRAGMTGENAFLRDRTLHQAAATVQVVTPGFRPAVEVRIPIDDKGSVDWVVGASLSF